MTISNNLSDTHWPDQELQQNGKNNGLIGPDHQAQQRHQDDRHTKASQSANECRAKCHCRDQCQRSRGQRAGAGDPVQARGNRMSGGVA